ncbi:hypothetical protein H5410_016759 [Solanum commersonii]|uniref:Uncharacterized protein n=1 Tax=Solanum commersonii TaxID=4109 RepID=A0A9J5ZYL9_SOLCO|nr:hypothetical protein H5410_016759 [Solanum commersonii]
MKVIAHLEQRIGELNLLVTQYHATSQNLPPDACQKGPMSPSFPTSSELNQGDHFTTFQQTQNASLTHSTQDTPLVYTFAPPKAPTVTHHAPQCIFMSLLHLLPRLRSFTAKMLTTMLKLKMIQKSTNFEMMSRKMKNLKDVMRGLRGFDSSQSGGERRSRLEREERGERERAKSGREMASEIGRGRREASEIGRGRREPSERGQ